MLILLPYMTLVRNFFFRISKELKLTIETHLAAFPRC